MSSKLRKTSCEKLEILEQFIPPETSRQFIDLSKSQFSRVQIEFGLLGVEWEKVSNMDFKCVLGKGQPNNRKSIVCDGNCAFQALSYSVTGREIHQYFGIKSHNNTILYIFEFSKFRVHY